MEINAMVKLAVAMLLCTTGAPDAGRAALPIVHRDAFAVRAQLGVPYAMGVLCDPKPCNESWLGIFAAGRPWGTAARQ